MAADVIKKQVPDFHAVLLTLIRPFFKRDDAAFVLLGKFVSHEVDRGHEKPGRAELVEHRDDFATHI